MRVALIERFGAPDVVKIVERPIPALEPRRVLIRVRAIGLNPVDAICRSGAASWIAPPFVTGFDAAGEIVAVGEGAEGAQGERVYVALSSGTAAEFILVDADDVRRLPAELSFDEGAGLGIPYLTAWNALFVRGKLVAGNRLLVRGAAGSVGTAAVQFAVAAGMTVVGTAGDTTGRDYLAGLGVAAVVDHSAPDVDDRARNAIGGAGFDAVLEPRSELIPRDAELLAPRGNVLVVGDRTEFVLSAQTLTSRRAGVLGVNVGDYSRGELEEAHAAIARGAAAGGIKPRIAARFPLSEIAAAHAALGRPGLNGKIVVNPAS